ncbi:uncharacterized protein K452DRAFT_24394 [Aplosporella prunicola CBS 121167]|uniref:Uncharacterized protein n=1 Tax=Aplosporella prunicola CBS 121167 TaxID=1176127 RepID=A0A6A6BEM6_9PEZI|nr:uncharacterized protein K452DRAFT_24394 [Aplosporella prunicola CBS 121167]KAF2141988.1 hypothetical protein K452DRAFT_24394 [Aplosporella prunicola CBS 121167]
MPQVNFTECKIKYTTNTTLQDLYHWNGMIKGINQNNATQISLEGCRKLCGTGNDYYEWSLASNTITTWVLPVIGMLLQAPFESNAFWHTVLAIARWVGSPMASLSYILWNMKVSGKCALMVDMAISYDLQIPDPKSDFSSIRDSFYILMAMNQFTMRRSQALNKEAEGLLRIVLFSKDLQLKDKGQSGKFLNERRQELAQKFRAGRKRGVVPVYVSTMWFLFSLALSIQTAFGDIGENATAHDLALGLLMAWLPVLILCSIVDRNPVAADDIRQKLNKLVQSVCDALQDDNIRNEFIQTFRGHQEADRLEALVNNIHLQSEIISGGDFFVDFAGQGRVRWHYGAAHPILYDIEDIWIATHGRGWLDEDEKDARMHLVLGSPEKGLLWFDLRGLWQVASAVLIVGGTCLGAFVLSYFTPTVGLGCRSGGYMIYCTMAFSLLVAEFVVWWITSPVPPKQPQWVRRSIGNIQRQPTFVRMEHSWRGLWFWVHSRLASFGHALESLSIRLTLRVLMILPFQFSAKERHLRDKLDQAKGWSFQKWAAIVFFHPLELCNTGWLLYTVLAQTFGIFRNCRCMTSYWGGGGGYLDFNQSDVTNNKWVKWYCKSIKAASEDTQVNSFRVCRNRNRRLHNAPRNDLRSIRGALPFPSHSPPH